MITVEVHINGNDEGFWKGIIKAEEMESLEAQEYSSDESVGTSLGDLFKNLKF